MSFNKEPTTSSVEIEFQTKEKEFINNEANETDEEEFIGEFMIRRHKKRVNTLIEEITENGISSHPFKKDLYGRFIFFLVYALILLQFIGVTITTDFQEDSYLYHYKVYFYFTVFMAIWSHLKASFQNPGKIIHSNNESVINFYITMREQARKNAKKLNEKLGERCYKETYQFAFSDTEGEESEDDKVEDVEKKGFKRKEKNLEEDDFDDSDISSFDSDAYHASSPINDETINKLSVEKNIVLSKCRQCSVVRFMRAHHCSYCKGCIMKKDTHYFWINNCVGQFNQKFYILFCWYSLSGTFTSFVICVYYHLYGHFPKVIEANYYFYLYPLIFQLFMAFFFVIFTLTMLADQWSDINNDTVLVNKKKKLVIEHRGVYSVMKEIFGGGFSLLWFIPYTTGGYYDQYIKLYKKAE